MKQGIKTGFAQDVNEKSLVGFSQCFIREQDYVTPQFERKRQTNINKRPHLAEHCSEKMFLSGEENENRVTKLPWRKMNHRGPCAWLLDQL